MRFSPSIFGKLLEAINRREFAAIVERHDADAYDKSFRSWDHMVALIYAQFSAAGSLRGLAAGWNANSQHHYHLASGALTRSTLSDAGKRRPAGVFAEVFARLAGQLDRQTRRDGKAIVLLTNDLTRTAVEIGALYKGRWQIELLFCWIKQHLKIRKFLGNNANANRLQLHAAMIAYALLRIAAMEKSPPVNPSTRNNRTSPNQMSFADA